MLNFIEKVIYINLEYRTDRKQQVETELRKVFPPEKIVRLNAIKDEKGGIGCSKSHIAALELAIENNWKNVLIVEDDLEWRNIRSGTNVFNSLVKNTWDVILLSGHFVKYDAKTYKLHHCTGRTAYVVSNHYYQTLLSNYKEALSNLIQHYTEKYRGDVFWQRLHRQDNWCIVMPQMCKQRPSYSDIEKKSTNYTRYLDTTPRPHISLNIFKKISFRRPTK